MQIAGVYAGTHERFGLARIGYGIENALVTRARAETFAARYPARTELAVYHEPARPQHVIFVRDIARRRTA